MKLSTNKSMSLTKTALMNEFFPWRLKNYLRKINVSPEDDGNRYIFKWMVFYRYWYPRSPVDRRGSEDYWTDSNFSPNTSEDYIFIFFNALIYLWNSKQVLLPLKVWKSTAIRAFLRACSRVCSTNVTHLSGGKTILRGFIPPPPPK